MTLDSTSRESNAKDSFKKHLVDSIKGNEGVEVNFDKGLNVPNIQGTAVNRWVAVQWGQLLPGKLTTLHAAIYVCTRNDPEGYRRSQLRDKVVGYLTDPNEEFRRITHYKSNDTPWTRIGTMMVYCDPESGDMEADDGTKFKIIPIRLRWAAKP